MPPKRCAGTSTSTDGVRPSKLSAMRMGMLGTTPRQAEEEARETEEGAEEDVHKPSGAVFDAA